MYNMCNMYSVIIEEEKHIARKKNARFKEELRISDIIRDSKSNVIFLSDYSCVVEKLPTWNLTDSNMMYNLYSDVTRKNLIANFEYIDILSEYIIKHM